MNTINLDPVELGKKLKLARQTKGLSQEKLAELAQTSCQNISKFENKGLSDINWIKTFSQILDVNLIGETETKQIEMTPIEKEIISFLIKEYGNCEYSYLLREIKIEDNTIKKEIESLCFNDWIKREVYDGWYDYKEDRLFLTNLGLIVYENSNINSIKAEELSEYKDDGIWTYEDVIFKLEYEYTSCYGVREIDDFQTFVNIAKNEKSIRNIYSIYVDKGHRKFVRDESSLYLINYIYYLKENIDYDNFLDLIGKDYEIKSGNTENVPYSGMYYPYDSFGKFTSCVDDDDVPLFYYTDVDLIPHIDCQADIEYRMKYGITNDVLLDFDESRRVLNIVENKSEEDNNFTMDEYKEYIKKHYRKPKTDYEKMLYKRIIELIKHDDCDNEFLCYFSFSKEWIDNGLAQLVLENLGILDYYKKAIENDFYGFIPQNAVDLNHEYYIPDEIREKSEKECDGESIVEDGFVLPFV